jgi:hypothetical protein
MVLTCSLAGFKANDLRKLKAAKAFLRMLLDSMNADKLLNQISEDKAQATMGFSTV